MGKKEEGRFGKERGRRKGGIIVLSSYEQRRG